GAAAGHNPLGHLGRCAPGAVVGTAGAVIQAAFALLVIALEPVVGALARDTHRLGGVGHRPPLLAHPPHQQQASLERQTGITVGHEDLRALVVTLDKPHLTRRSSSRQRTTARVTTGLAGYTGHAPPRAGAPPGALVPLRMRARRARCCLAPEPVTADRLDRGGGVRATTSDHTLGPDARTGGGHRGRLCR